MPLEAVPPNSSCMVPSGQDGLALVRRVAELHGGEVVFAAGLDGRGLGVEVVLPGSAESTR